MIESIAGKETGMTATTIQAGRADSPKIKRYREAERRLFSAYGLEPAERFIDLDEPRLRLRILEVGSGEPVIFLPGTGGTGPYWAPLLRELPGIRSILVDRPGWGLSTPVDYRRRDFGRFTAAILRGMLDVLGLDRVDLVGASVGSLWTLWLSKYEPNRVRRLVHLGGSPSVHIPVPTFFKLLTSPVGALIVRIPMSPKMLRSQLEAIGHGASLAEGKLDLFLPWRLAFANETASMHHERAMTQALRNGDGWQPGFVPTDADLSTFNHPVRMVFGSADPTGSVDLWREFANGLPHGELEVVEGAGHMPWWDEPQAVGRSVREFVAGSDPASATDRWHVAAGAALG
jgi:pimeloyl-ACP methyl ester carboxylesterase